MSNIEIGLNLTVWGERGSSFEFITMTMGGIVEWLKRTTIRTKELSSKKKVDTYW